MRAPEAALARHRFNFGLNPDMCSGLDLQVATTFVAIKFAGQSSLDVAWPRVMPFDQVAVVRVHDPHEVREIRGRARMEGATQDCGCGGEFGNEVRNLLGRVLKASRLDALNAFWFHLADY